MQNDHDFSGRQLSQVVQAKTLEMNLRRYLTYILPTGKEQRTIRDPSKREASDPY